MITKLVILIHAGILVEEHAWRDPGASAGGRFCYYVDEPCYVTKQEAPLGRELAGTVDDAHTVSYIYYIYIIYMKASTPVAAAAIADGACAPA